MYHPFGIMTTSNHLMKLLSTSARWTQSYRLLSTCAIRMVPVLSRDYKTEDKCLTRSNTDLLRNVEPNNYFIQIRTHVKIYPIPYNKNRRECYLDPTKTPYTDRTNFAEFQGVGEKRIKMRKPWMNVTPKEKEAQYNKYHWDDSYKSDPKEARQTAREKLDNLKSDLMSRGCAREAKPYEPPQDVADRIKSIYMGTLESLNISGPRQLDDIQLESIDLNQSKLLKLSLISRCIQEFNHNLPNSTLSYTSNLADLIEYYNTPVRGVNSYAALVRQSDELPRNLHMIEDPIRYDAENDIFFEGYTAYPGLVSKVNGLRGSKKYPTLNQKEFQWPDI